MALLDFPLQRRRPTGITLLACSDWREAVFPGRIVHLFISTVPAQSIFQMGNLGAKVAGNITAAHAGLADLLWGPKKPAGMGPFSLPVAFDPHPAHAYRRTHQMHGSGRILVVLLADH